ncbi:MAG: PQQ-binding-like beta-propeller repeat protein [Candidatus Bathyarchaeia archaeon]
MYKKIAIKRITLTLLILTLAASLLPTSIKIHGNPSDNWWYMFQCDPCRTGSSGSEVPISNLTLWRYQFSTEHGYYYFSPVVVDGRVYITVPYLQCINATTGLPLWYNLTVGINAFAPAVSSGKVYVCNGTNVYCLDAYTGSYIWKFATSRNFTWLNSAPIVAGDKVYVGNEGGIWCLNAATGSQIWYAACDAYYGVSLDGDRIFAARYEVDCMNATTGALLWYTHLNYMTWTMPVAYEGRIFIGDMVSYTNQTGVLRCLNQTTGGYIWNFTSNVQSPSLFPPAVGFWKVVVAFGAYLYCLRADNGEMLWWRGFYQPIFTSPVLSLTADSKVIVGSHFSVYCCSLLNGNTIWEQPTEDWVDSSPAIADGKIFVGSDDGYLYCFGSENIPPYVTITYPENMTFTNNSMVTVSGTAYDNVQVKSVKVRVNYGSWSIAVGTTSWSKNITLTFGSNIVQAQAFDSFNNPSSMETIYITFDDISPTIYQPIQSPSHDNVFPNQPVRVFALMSDVGTGIKNATLYYEVNENGTWIPCEMHFNESIGLYETEIPGYPENTLIKYKILAYDYAGNGAEQNGAGSYYPYTVIPEFPAVLMLTLLIATTTSALTITHHKRKPSKTPANKSLH